VQLDLKNSPLDWGAFASWLRKHAALVRSIKIHGEAELMAEDEDDPYNDGYSRCATIHGLQQSTHCSIAQQLLQQALVLATLQPAAASPAAAAAAAAAQ
jgi:hypothetical protein